MFMAIYRATLASLSPRRGGTRVFLFALFALTVSTQPLHAASAFVAKMHGNVEQRSPEDLEWQPVHPGEKLGEGVTVRTAEKSDAELTLSQGHSLKLHALTTL